MTVLKQQYHKLKQTLNSIQWQITFMITFCSVIVCVFLLILQYVKASYLLSDKNNTMLIANAVTRLLSDPWMQEEFSPGDAYDVVVQNRINDRNPPRRLEVQIGSFHDDIRLDINYLLESRVYIYYITGKREIFPLAFGGRPAVPLETLDKEDPSVSIEMRALAMADQSTGRSPYSQVIVTEDNYSMALVPLVNQNDQILGNFFLYVKQPTPLEMIRAIFASSIPSFLRLILFVLALGIIVGYIFSRRWGRWFSEISKASYRWAGGDFSRRIPLQATQDTSELHTVSLKLNEMAVQLEQVVQTRQELAASEERNRISRELHDNIKQQVFSINMNLGAAAMLADKKPEQVKEKIELASTLTGDTLRELDTLIGELRPPEISGEELIKKLEEYGENWQKSSGIQLEMALRNQPPMDEHTAGEVFRICQEALSNMARHSKASHGSIVLETDEIEIKLLVRDNGHGFDMNKEQTGIGLRSIRERVEKLNGTFNILSGKNGTSLSIYIPRKMSV